MNDSSQAQNWNELLLKSAITGNIDKAQEALDNGANVNYQSEYGFTPLMCACKHDNKEMITLLMKYNASSLLKNHDNDTARAFVPENKESLDAFDLIVACETNAKLTALIEDNHHDEQNTLNF